MRRMALACFLIALFTFSTTAAPQSPDQRARLLMAKLAATAYEPSSQPYFDGLAALGPAALPALQEGLRHRDAHVRFQALLLIGRLKEVNAERTPALVLALHDTDEHVRAAAQQILKVNGLASVPLLLPAMQHCRCEVRQAALEVVVELDARAAVDQLAIAVWDKDSVAHDAVAALEKLGSAARPAVPALLRLAERVPSLRIKAIKALVATKDERARQVVPLLSKALANCPNGQGRAFNAPMTAHEFFHGTDLQWRGLVNPASRSLRGLALLGPLAVDAAPEVRRLLGQENAWQLHREAAATLAAMGENPTPFVPQLLAVRTKESPLLSTDADRSALRYSSISFNDSAAMERRLLHDPALLDQLTRQLSDENINQWALVSAATALLDLRPEHHALLPHLRAAMQTTNDRGARIILLHAAAKLGPVAIPLLREQLSRVEEEPRDRALEELLRLTPRDPELIRLYLLRLADIGEDSQNREPLTHFLMVHRQAVAHAETAFMSRFLRDWDARVRAGAVRWLNCDGFDPATRLAVFRGALSDGSPLVRVAACKGVGDLGPRGAVMAPVLVQLVQQKDEEVAVAALYCLSAVGRAADTATLEMLDAFADHPESVRRMLRVMLHEAGPVAHPILEAGLKHANAEVRQCCIVVLGRAGNKASATLVRPLLRDVNLQVRHTAAVTLAQLDPSDPGGLPVLLEMLGDEATIAPAATALMCLGPTARPALKNLEVMLADQNLADYWRHVHVVLAAIGPEGLPLLRAGLHDEDAGVREQAVRNLAAANAPGRVDDLLAVLQGGQEKERAVAAELLGGMGAKALAAVPALRRAARQDKPKVCMAAAVALAHIKGRDRATAILLTSLLDPITMDMVRMGRGILDNDTNTVCMDALLLAADPTALPPTLTRMMLIEPQVLQDLTAVKNLVGLGPVSEPHLRWLLRHPHRVIRAQTILALGYWPGSRADLESLLLPVVQHEPAPRLRQLALEILGRRHAAPELVLPWLRDQPVLTSTIEEHFDEQRRDQLLDQLIRAKELPMKGFPRSSRRVSYSDYPLDLDEVRELLVKNGQAAMPILLAKLEHPNRTARQVAIQALGDIGPAAKAALPALRRLLQSETDLPTRASIWHSIDAIVPPR